MKKRQEMLDALKSKIPEGKGKKDPMLSMDADDDFHEEDMPDNTDDMSGEETDAFEGDESPAEEDAELKKIPTSALMAEVKRRGLKMGQSGSHGSDEAQPDDKANDEDNQAESY